MEAWVQFLLGLGGSRARQTGVALQLFSKWQSGRKDSFIKVLTISIEAWLKLAETLHLLSVETD